ncbi:MAG: MFS transporter [Sphaerochaeta sp.]|jgi:MFS family permease|nr:MFS transporter [Sphaerochaeta sp.]PKL27651.1 MAG: MFS transporter [Spirochaetae bacterium HGW-Spirochaetae-2]
MNSRTKDIYVDSTRVYRFLFVMLLVGLTHGLYKGIQDNYLAEIVRINEFERGIVEFFRELPGLMLIFILATMYRFSETKVFKLGTAITLTGTLGLLLFGTGKVVVVLFMVLYSLGEHIVMPVKSTISLHLAKSGNGGASLGITSAISHGGNIIGFLLVTGLFLMFPRLGIEKGSLGSFKIIFFLATILLVGATLVVLAMKDKGEPVKRRQLYFNRKFGKYYGLEIFYGSRKQVFITFAPYVLILQYGADTSVISLLLGICAVFGMVLSPLVGRLIDRLGYKFIMVTDTLLLIVVCFFYGFSHRLFSFEVAYIVVCVNFVLDSILSLGSLASTVYVQDISDNPQEITSTITTGISVNHLISVIIALLGGFIWQKTGIEMLFTMSALLGLANSIFAMTIKVPKKA